MNDNRLPALIRRTQVHPQHAEAVLDAADGIAQHGEVSEVGLRLAHEVRTLVARHRWQRALPHGVSTLTETGGHRVDIESIGHVHHRTGGRPVNRSLRTGAQQWVEVAGGVVGTGRGQRLGHLRHLGHHQGRRGVDDHDGHRQLHGLHGQLLDRHDDRLANMIAFTRNALALLVSGLSAA